jgi:hypothetical protein
VRQNRLNDLLESANTIRPITDVMLGLSVARIIGLWASESEMGAESVPPAVCLAPRGLSKSGRALNAF